MNFVKKYKEINKCDGYKSRFRNYFRSLALNGLSKFNKIKGIEEHLKKPRIQILYFHHVFQDEEEKLELLLRKLNEYHTFISYSNAVKKILNRNIDKPYIVISFDDGFKNNLRAGKILNKYGITACFFINPSIIGVNDYGQIKRFCRDKLNFPPVEFLDWDDVISLMDMGHEIGSHTMNHINIAETSREEMEKDIKRSYEILSQKCGSVEHFAFPYGRFFHFNEEGGKVVFNVGFNSCATAERGCHINPEVRLSKEKLFIRRDHIVLDWNIDHILYFIVNNAKRANTNNILSPYS